MKSKRVQPLVAPNVAFITLLIELASLSNNSFYGFIGLGIYISKKALLFKLCIAKDLTVILSRYYIKSPLVTY